MAAFLNFSQQSKCEKVVYVQILNIMLLCVYVYKLEEVNTSCCCFFAACEYFLIIKMALNAPKIKYMGAKNAPSCF